MIRDGRSTPDGVPRDGDVEAIENASLAPVTQGLGLAPASAVKSTVGPSIDVLVVPGENGVFLLMHEGRGGFFGFGATIETALRGDPIGSSGSTLFGMAPDGISNQLIRLRDGSTIQARVVKNLYAVTDPSRSG